MPIYKDEKKKTWFASFYYTDWTGTKKKKKKEGFRTQREAKEFERTFLESKSGKPEISFSVFATEYLKDCETRLKPTSYNNKEHIVRTKYMPFFGAMQICNIKPIQIRTWQNEMMQHGYSDMYLKTLNNQLSAMFNYAKKYYNIQSNPVTECGTMGKSNSNSIDFWTLGEFEQFISTVDNPQKRLIFSLLFWSGMRGGELLALTYHDFDFNENSIRINKNYARLNKEDLTLSPKTPKSTRTILMPQFIMDEVKKYYEMLYDYQSHERLFPVTKSYLLKYIKSQSKAANVKSIRLHDLRHSHASYLIERGFSPLLIAERLGHEKVETTLQIYSH